MITFHRLALADVWEAQVWYRERSLPAALKFHSALDSTLSGIADDPGRFAEIRPGYQYARMFGFPYIVVFKAWSADRINVMAVMHTSRQTDFWIDRDPRDI